jgi:ribosomal protein S6--L-glutamate ligase
MDGTPLSVAIFTDSPTVMETRLVAEALRSRGAEPKFIAPWDISLPEPQIPDSGVVYVPSNMLHRGSTFEFSHRLLLLRELEKKNRVVNPVDSMLTYSKTQLSIQMKRIGVSHPNTLVTENVEEAYEFARSRLDSGREVVLKPICKARGVGVVKLTGIRSRGDLLQFLVWYNREHAEGVYYLQDFVPNVGYDVRCMVVGDRVIGRERRFNPNDFRYNVSAGGSAENYASPEFDELAVRVAKTANLDITGIDVLPGEDGKPYILEANCYPGYKALMDATGINVPGHIADYLLSLL